MKFPRFAHCRRRTPGTMNKLESRYCEVLALRKQAGEILDFWREGITFKLAQDTRYTPDFVVLMPEGTIQLHEIKGFMEQHARVKIKVAADKFPFQFIVVRRKESEWSYEYIEGCVEGVAHD